MGETLSYPPDKEFLLYDQYGLEGPISYTQSMRSGQNRSHKIETPGGAYFIRGYRDNVAEQTFQSESLLINYLFHCNVPVPRIIRNRQGELVSRTRAAKPFFLSDFVWGDLYPGEATDLNQEQLIQAAMTLGSYHAFILGKHPVSRVPADVTEFCTGSFFFKSNIIRLWEAAIAIIINREADEVDKQLLSISQQKLQEINGVNEATINSAVSKLPSVLAHGDYLPQNLIFRDGKVVAITDWELARYQPKVWEVTRAMCGFCKLDSTTIFNTPIDIDKARLFLSGYEMTNSLSSVEKDLIVDLAFLGSLAPLFILRSRYVIESNRADMFVPKTADYWNWWSNNYDIVKKALGD